MSQPRTGRTLQLVRFIAALAWVASSRLLATSSARGLTNRFNIDAVLPLLRSLIFLFLLVVGFSVLETLARHRSSARGILGLPNRSTWKREWLLGAALGWGMVLITVLPLALTGHLYVTFWTQPGTLLYCTLALLALLVSSLIIEVIFRGYPFRCMVEIVGPVMATIILSVLYGVAQAIANGATSPATYIAVWAGIVFSVAWFRTHGLWLAWGMRFAWMASMGVLFGLPVSGSQDFSVLIQTIASGPLWLTGGSYGPEAAWLSALALLAGLIVLVRITRDYAWNYTHPPIIPGGYPMEAKPPAAHVAMEQAQQNRPPDLVQILPTSPQGRSAGDPPDA
ncbi:CPBP family intramembrane metalloprotease [Edaphobacter sp. 4G125]|nr:CPBP family intramembrane metalloprotease [Edaphobacter sp. 4G125]